jgi:hypothetical protein
MAVVFRARDERLDRQVALKVLPPAAAAGDELRQRFLREARAAAAIDDPHIIPVYEAGEADGVLFIAMRYVAGGDVGSLLRRDGALPPGRAAAVICAVAAALDTAHEAGLVHRDVKPTNMLLDARPGRPDHVYLADFGISHALTSARLTQSGHFMGTLAYSAPEQIAGEAADGRADEYALACAAYELLTGAPPFPHQQVTALIWAHMSQPPPRPTSRRPDLPPAVDAVLARALAKAPGDRYASCGEFADLLCSALARRPAGPDREPAASLRPAPRSYLPVMPGPLLAGAGTGAGPAGRGGIEALAFSPDGSALAASAPGGRACLWDMTTGGMTAALASPDSGGPGAPDVTALAFSPDGQLLAAADAAGRTALWSPGAGRLVVMLPQPESGGVPGVAFSPDGSTLAAGGADGITCLWDVATRSEIAALARLEGGGVSGVAFSPDGLTLAAGGAGGVTCLWDVRAGSVTVTLAVPGAGPVSGVAFSPDGTLVATGDADGGAYLWDPAGRWLATLADPAATSVLAVAFSPDGSTLAAADASGRLYLWSVRRRRRLAVLAERTSRCMLAVAFSPDGSTLAAGDANGRAYLWSWTHRRGIARQLPLILEAGTAPWR